HMSTAHTPSEAVEWPRQRGARAELADRRTTVSRRSTSGRTTSDVFLCHFAKEGEDGRDHPISGKHRSGVPAPGRTHRRAHIRIGDEAFDSFMKRSNISGRHHNSRCAVVVHPSGA